MHAAIWTSSTPRHVLCKTLLDVVGAHPCYFPCCWTCFVCTIRRCARRFRWWLVQEFPRRIVTSVVRCARQSKRQAELSRSRFTPIRTLAVLAFLSGRKSCPFSVGRRRERFICVAWSLGMCAWRSRWTLSMILSLGRQLNYRWWRGILTVVHCALMSRCHRSCPSRRERQFNDRRGRRYNRQSRKTWRSHESGLS